MTQARILVVDDEASARALLTAALSDAGYEVLAVADGFKALNEIENFEPELTITDLLLPGMNGVELVRRLRARKASAAVVVATASSEPSSIIAAMRAGARDYLCKPLDLEELLSVVERAVEQARIANEVATLRAGAERRSLPPAFVGSCPEIVQLFKAIAQVAPSRATVLVTGESGTGKELVARAIHERSPRANRPLVPLHCAALSEGVLESELFGHERGAFTGAAQRRKGRLEEADGGTLFLDEIGEISPSVQVKLLRVLQERAFERVGSSLTHHADLRFIAATNRNLRELVAQGKFRQDLWYRLNVVNIHLPPLRERRGDIVALATHFLDEQCALTERGPMRFSDAALARMLSYSWPGNVRELKNVVEHAVVFADGDVIEEGHLPVDTGARPTHRVPPIPGSSLSELERYAILRTVEATAGSRAKAAAVLGVSVRKLQYRLQQYSASPRGIKAPLKPFHDA